MFVVTAIIFGATTIVTLPFTLSALILSGKISKSLESKKAKQRSERCDK